MIRNISPAAALVGLLVSTPVFAADLAMEVAPPMADAPSRAYATVFAGASQPSADVTAFDGEIPIGITFDVDFDVG